jgi:hypothetical protein
VWLGLTKPMQALGQWAKAHIPQIGSARAKFDASNDRH